MNLRNLIPSLLLMLLSCFSLTAQAANPEIKIETSKGDIVLELYQDKAPITVDNFLAYIKQDAFKNSLFHRVIPGFMIQGGGFAQDYQRLATNAPIKNEASNGLSNSRGTIAMARTNAPDSATRQFFINHANNTNLDQGAFGAGYAVFGKVTSGIEVVDAIANVATGTTAAMPGARDVPTNQVVIKSIQVIEAK
ncbi:peptidylprolyl isomerase [Motilimonas cestriensis]|uniref:Peptidyl-prolyl cis-trans isomerase n=1 Tax=Motilimonas cestriensis TaxID=2742685 RepID=A0ABS8W776_9GAMM|nr:peptidylprolyl isomerase [Motilimonas cestriensis]MCE2593613.1 peptidylprolyl isomerase [Motilimonas cestriensis]